MTASTMLGERFLDAMGEFAQDFEDPEASLALIESLLEDTAECPSVEIAVAKPDRRDLSMTTFLIDTPNGAAMTGVLIRDVTEERDLERRRDTFVSVASHELRTLVTTILGFTELLLDDVHEGDQRRWLEHVHEDSLRLTSILDDMLDVSRIQSGRVKMTIERVDVPDVINDVIVGVTDQGLGIPSEEIDRVFDTFYRLKNEQTYEIRGTGLGLYIVKSLIEGIGGTLNVESEARVGSTFSFSMPESL